MAFTTVMTTTGDVADSIITLELENEAIYQYGQMNVMDPFVEYDQQIGAKSIAFPRYTLLALATTPLDEDDDVVSEALVDSEVILTPAEHGKPVTNTKLANLQTGGRSLRAAGTLVGINMGQTTNKLAVLALEATTNIIFGGTATSEATIVAGDVMTGTVMDRAYNKLARVNVPVHPVTGTYVAFMHEDVIYDLREAAAANSWTDVNKYNNEIPVLMNEVGMYKGFRIVRNNHALLNVDAGAVDVDTYHSSFIGFNALGKAESQVPAITITGPFDKLGRFVNVGWYGVFQYKIIEPAAVFKAITSSSIGAN